MNPILFNCPQDVAAACPTAYTGDGRHRAAPLKPHRTGEGVVIGGVGNATDRMDGEFFEGVDRRLQRG